MQKQQGVDCVYFRDGNKVDMRIIHQEVSAEKYAAVVVELHDMRIAMAQLYAEHDGLLNDGKKWRALHPAVQSALLEYGSNINILPA